jgi:hypothetical protein
MGLGGREKLQRLIAEKPEMNNTAFVRGGNAHMENGSNSQEAALASESAKSEGQHCENEARRNLCEELYVAEE